MNSIVNVIFSWFVSVIIFIYSSEFSYIACNPILIIIKIIFIVIILVGVLNFSFDATLAI